MKIQISRSNIQPKWKEFKVPIICCQAFDLCGWAMEELDWRAPAAAVEALAASAPGGHTKIGSLTLESVEHLIHINNLYN